MRKAVVDRLGLLPENHRQRFWEARLGPEDRPFAYGQQLKDAAATWLEPDSAGGVQGLPEKVVLEQHPSSVGALPSPDNPGSSYYPG